MAVSPPVTAAPPAEPAAKTLAVRQGSRDQGQPTSSAAEPELAEQLNADIRRRYIKGNQPYTPITSSLYNIVTDSIVR